jgi:HEAT repeat protein
MTFANDPRTTEELFQASLQGDYEDEAAWDAVAALRLRGTEEVFRSAVEFTRSGVPLQRARGLDVLAQLKVDHDQSVAIAIAHLKDENSRVVESAAWALAHLGGDSSISALIAIGNHTNPFVRLAVANGVAGSEREGAVATLIELMDDADDEVRDWATFGLGTQCSVDSPAIRDALRKRLKDAHDQTRAEAIWGLAQRKDKQGTEMLINSLLDPEHGSGHEQTAAGVLDVPRDTPTEQLLDGLRKLLA